MDVEKWLYGTVAVLASLSAGNALAQALPAPLQELDATVEQVRQQF